jgi:septal ring factor EnvC (AmiA/AmiB activator)
LREIQKAFTDSTHPENKFCQPYSAILAWAQNFPFYLQHSTQLSKLISDISKAKKELELKIEKTQNIKNALASIEANIDNLQKSIQDDEQRIAQYEQLHRDLQDKARYEQSTYVQFEKIFFQELEQFVIQKKLRQGIKNIVVRH